MLSDKITRTTYFMKTDVRNSLETDCFSRVRHPTTERSPSPEKRKLEKYTKQYYTGHLIRCLLGESIKPLTHLQEISRVIKRCSPSSLLPDNSSSNYECRLRVVIELEGTLLHFS